MTVHIGVYGDFLVGDGVGDALRRIHAPTRSLDVQDYGPRPRSLGLRQAPFHKGGQTEFDIPLDGDFAPIRIIYHDAKVAAFSPNGDGELDEAVIESIEQGRVTLRRDDGRLEYLALWTDEEEDEVEDDAGADEDDDFYFYLPLPFFDRAVIELMRRPVEGPPGVGKTSLLRAIVGQQPISAGSILWNGEDISREPQHQRARRVIAIVPQAREIFPLLTVCETSPPR